MDSQESPSDDAKAQEPNTGPLYLEDSDLEGDTLREECGVFGIFGHPEAGAITALGLHALQHRGQEAAGIVSFDGARFHSERRLGLVGPIWSTPPDGFAIGHAAFGLPAMTLWMIAVVALVAIVLGAATRVACLAFVFAASQLSVLTPNSESGLDMLARVVFVVLALSQCNARWSIDAWLARRLGRTVPALLIGRNTGPLDMPAASSHAARALTGQATSPRAMAMVWPSPS